jgi:hypothetical protein
MMVILMPLGNNWIRVAMQTAVVVNEFFNPFVPLMESPTTSLPALLDAKTPLTTTLR